MGVAASLGEFTEPHHIGTDDSAVGEGDRELKEQEELETAASRINVVCMNLVTTPLRIGGTGWRVDGLRSRHGAAACELAQGARARAIAEGSAEGNPRGANMPPRLEAVIPEGRAEAELAVNRGVQNPGFSEHSRVRRGQTDKRSATLLIGDGCVTVHRRLAVPVMATLTSFVWLIWATPEYITADVIVACMAMRRAPTPYCSGRPTPSLDVGLGPRARHAHSLVVGAGVYVADSLRGLAS